MKQSFSQWYANGNCKSLAVKAPRSITLFRLFIYRQQELLVLKLNNHELRKWLLSTLYYVELRKTRVFHYNFDAFNFEIEYVSFILKMLTYVNQRLCLKLQHDNTVFSKFVVKCVPLTKCSIKTVISTRISNYSSNFIWQLDLA